MRRALLCVVAAGVAGVVSCGAASAAMQTVFAPLSATISEFSGEVSFQYPVPLFDTQGGTRVLTGVQIGGTAVMTADVVVLNGDGMPAAFGVQYAAGFNGLLPGGVATAFQSSTQTELALFPGSFRAFQFVFEAPIMGGVSNIAALSSTNGGGVMQTGTFTAGLTLPPSSTLVWSPATLQLGGAVEIQYTYEIVPAPGAGVVLMGGVMMMGRRRRRGA